MTSTNGLQGVLRVLYFLALASIATTFVIGAVTRIYEGPSGQEVTSTFRAALVDQDQEDYDRNLGIIFSLLSYAMVLTAVTGFPQTWNGIRAGLFVAGVTVFFTGVVYAGSGSDDWLLPIWAFLALVTLVLCARSLEDGGDWALKLRPMERRSASPHAPEAPS